MLGFGFRVGNNKSTPTTSFFVVWFVFVCFWFVFVCFCLVLYKFAAQETLVACTSTSGPPDTSFSFSFWGQSVFLLLLFFCFFVVCSVVALLLFCCFGFVWFFVCFGCFGCFVCFGFVCFGFVCFGFVCLVVLFCLIVLVGCFG